MLVACPACHRQQDVGSHAPGTRVRCPCGHLCTVPDVPSRPMAMAHCSSCGGRLEPDATRCAFCEAVIALGDRGYGETCPECFARMLKDARYCSSCGVAIAPVAILKALASTECPRCEGELVRCETADAPFVECTSCGGLWLQAEVFERLAAERERSPEAALPGRERRDERTPPAREQQVRYLRCPVCRRHMNRRNFADASGVVIDWCRGHGYWFDVHELETVLAFVGSGGLERARAARAERERLEADIARLRRPELSKPARVERGTPATLGSTLAEWLLAFL